METRVKDLTTEELRELIYSTIREALEELSEDMAALSSDDYVRSIDEARRDYSEGRAKRLEELFDVYDHPHTEGTERP